MNKRMEQLQVMIQQDKLKVPSVKLKVKAPKKVKVVAPRFLKPAPVAPIVFDPTLMECIQKLTPEEAASPKNVVGTVMLFIADELLRCPRPTMATLSDNALSNYVYICEQVWADQTRHKTGALPRCVHRWTA